MKRLYIFCEGATEQGFCQQVLDPHLQSEILIHPILVAHNRRRGRVHRGGIPDHFQVLHDDIQNEIKRHQHSADVFFSTMIDLYGLPRDFPGMTENTRIPENPTLYVEALERAFAHVINDRRFVPYIQLHEFETLLFADLDAFDGKFNDVGSAIQTLKRIASSFPSVEHINDGQPTAPSRRIIGRIPEYEAEKVTAGPSIAKKIGLYRLREACPHFGAWVTRLEGL